jgi:hypothetical protein
VGTDIPDHVSLGKTRIAGPPGHGIHPHAVPFASPLPTNFGFIKTRLIFESFQSRSVAAAELT